MINIETDVIIAIVMKTAKIGSGGSNNEGGGTAATKENATIGEIIVETSIEMATKTGTTSGRIEVGRPVDIRKTYWITFIFVNSYTG